MSRFLASLALLALSLSPTLAQEVKSPLAWSFETEADNPFVVRENVTMTRVQEHASDGQYALRVVAKGSEKPSWPALWLYPDKAHPDWSSRSTLTMDIFLETPEPVYFGAQLCVLDRQEAKTVGLGDLKPGWNRGLTLWMQDFGWELTRVRDLCLYLGSPRQDVIYTIDNVRFQADTGAQAGGGWLNVQDFGASGSRFETTATTTPGSRQITVAEGGDLQVGQQITVSRCNIRYLSPTLWGPGEPYSTAKPLGDALEMRGYDGAGGSWLAFIVEIDSEDPLTFRWKGDIAKPWDASKVPVTHDWQPLSGGVEVRLKRQEWKRGQMVTFAARDQLTTTIEKIEGKVITLRDAPNRATTAGVVRHTDRQAIQQTIDRALRQRCHVFFPAGHYRIPGGLRVPNAKAIRLEGANAAATVLDISDGSGSCFGLQGGTEVTLRNFSMVGHTGLAEAPLSFTTCSGYGFWPNSLKGCNAVGMSGTERVLIENVHVSRMANEAFYAQGPSRQGKTEPAQYQKSLTYLRCSVTDCAANAFNNNDMGENTSILYCRVDGAGWHAAEMPARFLRVEGSYFRNTGAITVGDMSHRYEDLNELGCGQAFICNNVFEGIGRCGGIAVNHGSSQVVISGNLFINFNGNAITVSNATVRPTLPWYKPDAPLSWGSYPSRSVVIRDNILDLTCVEPVANGRTGITVSGSAVTVANNQIYVRGQSDPRVTGLRLSDPALNLTVHDNQITNCGTGLVTGRASSRITQVEDNTTFLEASLPLEWRYTHQYQGWRIHWLSGAQAGKTSTLAAYDPTTLRFKLTAPAELKVGDSFEVYSPQGPHWNLHDNTLAGCQTPVLLDSYGGPTAFFSRNTVERGGGAGVKYAVDVRGQFALLGNRFLGFDEPGSTALALSPDKLGQPLPNLLRDNVFERCANVAAESQPGLWQALQQAGNLFVECGKKPGG